MDIQAYISSGIIENYVLGATTPEENAEIERLAQEYPEIQQEIEANKHALLAYVLDFAEEPPADIRDKVLSKLDQLADEEETDDDNFAIEKEIADIQEAPSRQLFPFKTYMVAASFVLLVASFSANVYFYSQWQQTKDNLNVALLDKQMMANTLKTKTTQQSQVLDQVKEELAILKSPAIASVKLASVDGAPPCSAKIYWDTKTKYVYIDASKLPEPPKNKQYQLWYIDGKNTVDAGVFDMGKKSDHLQKLKLVPNAQAFAVTLEKMGGVPKSEGDLYALGKMENETREN
ncbi:anti-sigma factor [uncultured Microscilla sp.]|uniref:anti-sigma factor n=1 Tax=uncultured Microscilla sp. TaxID=432653 RepID=UPI002627E7F8|nr:anti-sigma factor [uncultured Microscilla sp.]